MDKQTISDEEVAKIRDQIRAFPAWRKEADRAAGYYDGMQINKETLSDLEAKGFGPLICNIVKPVVNTLLGMEAKNRTDWRVVSDDDEHQHVAEALSAKLLEAERETRADQAISEAYSEEVKSGLGWVEVGRSLNPFEYPYSVTSVHRREMFWDWQARRPDLGDARWLVREKWYPVKQVIQYFPDKEDLITTAGTGWGDDWVSLAEQSDVLAHAFRRESELGWQDHEWRNREAQMVQVREIWYRIFTRCLVIKLPNGRTVKFDKDNIAHAMAVALGSVQPKEAVITTLRVSIWIGPHMLQDIAHHCDKLPYIPFWGYREDATGAPYGVIRDMIPMQDEVNARRRKLLWLLSSKRVMADSDALDTQYNDFSDLVREVARPDAVVVLNPSRRNVNGVMIETDLSLSAQQFEVMRDSEEAIQRVAGVYNSVMGKTDGAKSGTAIQSLVEQGQTSVADLNDNYRYARSLVGERLLDLILADLKGQTNVKLMSGEPGRQKIVMANVPTIDHMTGSEYLENDLNRIQLKVALADVPSTPAYRQQQMVQIGEVLKSLPPEIQATLVPFYLEATDLPKRREMADLIRKQLGIDPEGQQAEQQVPPEIQAQMQQGMQMIQQLQAENQQLKSGQESKMAEVQLKAQQFQEQQAFEQAKMQAQLQVEQAKLEFEKLMRTAELKIKRESEQKALETRLAEAQMRAEYDKAAKLEIAKIQADLEKMRIDADLQRSAAEAKRQDEEMRRKEDETKPEDDGKDGEMLKLIQSMQQSTLQMGTEFAKAVATVAGPKKVVRDKDGNMTGVEPA